MNKAAPKEYLFLEFDRAIKYGRKFAITSLTAMIGLLVWIILLVAMAGATISVMNKSESSGQAVVMGGWVLWFLLLLVIGVIEIISLVYNVLAAVKYGNVFNLINPTSSTLEGEDDIKKDPEIFLTTKNIRNFLWIHLIIAVLGGLLLFCGLLFSLAAAVISIVMVILVLKNNNKLMEWRKTGTIDRTK